MADNRKISTYETQRGRIVKEEKGVDLVSVLAKSVGCSDGEKKDIKKDERRLMAVERRSMATCDGGESAGNTK